LLYSQESVLVATVEHGQERVDIAVESSCFFDGKVIQVYLHRNKFDGSKYN
jgi:hypothetical protein